MNNHRGQFMLDTNVFNRILDGKIELPKLRSGQSYFVTHIQLDELNATRDEARKGDLLRIFNQVPQKKVSTTSAVWDVSKWDEAGWSHEETLIPTESLVIGVSRIGLTKISDGSIYSKLKNTLDTLKKKSNNIQDALIAETSIKNGWTLVSEDQILRTVVQQIGGKVISFKDFILP